MMPTVYLPLGGSEDVRVAVMEPDGTPLLGLTDVFIAIQRSSDDKWLDFDDMTFKSTGFTQQRQLMAEEDPVLAPSIYHYEFDTSPWVLPDVYIVEVSQVPQTTWFDILYGEIRVGEAYIPSGNFYIDVAAVRDAGVTEAMASNVRVSTLIETWQMFVDRVTGQWFRPRSLTLDLDGNGTTLLQLSVPIIELTDLYVNGDFDTPLAATAFVAYAGRGGTERDDRRNPRVKLVAGDSDVFAGVGPYEHGGTVFEVGEQNQRLVGTFGFVEPGAGMEVPAPIRYALTKLVVRSCSNGMLGGSAAGPIVEEETDRHRRRYSDQAATARILSATGDPEVDQILAMYKAPLRVRAPRTLFRRPVGGL